MRRACSDGTRKNGFELEKHKFGLKYWEKILCCESGERLRLFKEVMDPSSLELLRAR